MATAGSLLLFIALLLLIILPTIKRQNSLKPPPRTPYRPDKYGGPGKRASNMKHDPVRHISGERKPTNYGNIGYTAVNIEPPEEDLYDQTSEPEEHLSRQEAIKRNKVKIANEVNRLVDEAATRVTHQRQHSRHKKHRSPTAPQQLKSHLLFDDEERQITPVNTYSSSLVSSAAGNRDYMQKSLLGTQRATVPFYDNSQDRTLYREWKESSKQKKHRRSKSYHTKNRGDGDMDHEEERKRRHTEVQRELARDKSPQRRDLRRQDSFISNLGLIVEEDESGPEYKLPTQTVQLALPEWHKESVSTYLLPLSTDGTSIARKQAPSPPPPDF